jgi:hypothetical protein
MEIEMNARANVSIDLIFFFKFRRQNCAKTKYSHNMFYLLIKLQKIYAVDKCHLPNQTKIIK